MKTKIKFSLTLITLAILSTSILASRLNKMASNSNLKSKTNAKVELKTQTEVEAEGKSNQIPIIGSPLIPPIPPYQPNPVDCTNVNDNEDELHDISCDNQNKDFPTPQNNKNCRDADQKDPHVWTRLYSGGRCPQFHDVGVNSEGLIVTVGVDGKAYIYNYDYDNFSELEGDFELNHLRRIDIGYDGLIYVVNIAGDTYYLNCNKYWVKLPGCAIDIGTGRGDEVAKIGCDDYCEDIDDLRHECGANDINKKNTLDNRSKHIYRLVCKCDCRCCRRRCNLFVPHVFTCEKDIDRKCYWLKYPRAPCYVENVGEGDTEFECEFERIDVNSNGYPMVIARCKKNNLIRYVLYQMVGGDKNIYVQIHVTEEKLNDLCGDNYGNIFYVQNGNSVWIYSSLNGDEPIVANGAISQYRKVRNISCGPYAQPTITMGCCLYTTTKVGYN